MVEERYICPHCDGWKGTMRYMPDNQGEFWLLCRDCNTFSNLPDRAIIAELEYLQIQIENELKMLLGRTWHPSESAPKGVAKRARAGPLSV